MERRLHPKERVLQLQNPPSTVKKFHFVNASAQDRASYDKSVRSFVLKGVVYSKKGQSDKRRQNGEVAPEATTPCDTHLANGRHEPDERTRCPVRSVKTTEWLRDMFFKSETPIGKFQQGSGDPFHSFGRTISNLEWQLIQDRMWESARVSSKTLI